MSILFLLIAAGIVAALAFFFAGLLLAHPRRVPVALPPPLPPPAPDEALGREIERLRSQQRLLETALAEARASAQSAAASRPSQDAGAGADQTELDNLRWEAARLSADGRTLAERLRIAEEENRSLLDRVEKSAEAWQAQLQASQGEQKQTIRVLRDEIAQRTAEIAKQAAEKAAEKDRLTKECDRQGVRADQAARALAEVQKRLEQQSQEREREKKRLEEAVRAAEEAVRAAEEHEHEAARRLAEVESSHERQLAAAKDALRAQQATAHAEAQQWAERLRHAEAAGRANLDEKGMVDIRLRAFEESLAHERQETLRATEALRSAQARLADLDRLAQENSELREQQSQAAREAQLQVDREGAVKDARVELAAAQAKLNEMASVLEENRRLRDEAAELAHHQEASTELERLSAAHKQLRLDAELMARRLQELMQDRSELVSLRSQAAEAASLVEEVAYLRRREKDLEALLYSSGVSAEVETRAAAKQPGQTPVSDMEGNLQFLVANGGPRTAVLADVQGFLIASVGEPVTQEGLAAFAAVAGEMVSRARALLPLAEADSVRITDKNNTVLTCHLFSSAGEGLGVATLGPAEAKAADTARAIAGLAAIVSGENSPTSEEPSPT
jgi:hypothetical protein